VEPASKNPPKTAKEEKVIPEARIPPTKQESKKVEEHQKDAEGPKPHEAKHAA